MEMLKIGLIATGGRGKNGNQAHNPEKGVEIVAGCDITETAEQEFKEQFPNAAFYKDYK